MLAIIKKTAFGLSILSVAGITTLGIAKSASAFTFTNTTTGPSVTIDSTDKYKYFQVKFNGNVERQNVFDLSSEAVFQFLGFQESSTTVTTNTKEKGKLVTKTETVDTVLAKFNIFLKNTTNEPQLLSRVSALGFNTDKTDLSGSTSAVKSGSDVLFSNAIIGGSFPNNFGAVDICFTDGSNCQGAQNGGVSNSTSITGTYQEGSFQATIALKRSPSDGNLSNYKLNLGNFGVRYQSITDGELGVQGFNDDSGTGRGITIIDYKPKPRKIPESSPLGAVLLTGMVVLTYSQKRKPAKQII